MPAHSLISAAAATVVYDSGSTQTAREVAEVVTVRLREVTERVELTVAGGRQEVETLWWRSAATSLICFDS